MKHTLTTLMASLLAMAAAMPLRAQSEIYPQHFDLEQVTLLDGPLHTAMMRNVDVLLSYDTDRLLTPFVRQAGLSATTDTSSPYYRWEQLHPNHTNWGSGDFRLDGHVGGHYMSALALAYAACHDETKRTALRTRVKYIIGVLADCQQAYDQDTEGMRGYLGGQPCNQAWRDTYRGQVGQFGPSAVPLYCQHKVLAGLRDMALYMDDEDARTALTLYRGLCDWQVQLVSRMSDETLQRWLRTEHGGINETLADAYRLLGDEHYLTAAQRYSHQRMIDGLQQADTAFLDNHHANTQVPKYIGFARIAQEDTSLVRYRTSAMRFWDDVATHRTVCIGGNSVNEHFLATTAAHRYIDETNGPESCNTNNMLKLSETLFDMTHDSRYADFYEAATYNHILSTQDPVTGGYVYFTPLRPQSYRIYSQPDQDMWCCVGTGMENHSRYGHFIYTHAADTLYVNLFTPSRLADERFALTQRTRFPYQPSTCLTIDREGTYTLAIRRPHWAGEDYAVSVNGTPAAVTMRAGYALMRRNWQRGDTITVQLPMAMRVEECPGMPDYIALHYGPLLMGARTTAVSPDDGTGLPYEQLPHEYAHGERMGHAPDSYAPRLALSTMPMLIGQRQQVLQRVTPLPGDSLTFSLDVSRHDDCTPPSYTWQTLRLEPYYRLHHSRVCNYLYQATPETYARSTWARSELDQWALAQRTLCSIDVGQQQAEAGAVTYDSLSTSGTWRDESYRDTRQGGYIQAVLDNPDTHARDLALMLRLCADDHDRACTVYVNGLRLCDYTVPAHPEGVDEHHFYNLELPLGALLHRRRSRLPRQLTVRIVPTTWASPGIYWMRLVRPTEAVSPLDAASTRRIHNRHYV